jgi:hypothetical protein
MESNKFRMLASAAASLRDIAVLNGFGLGGVELKMAGQAALGTRCQRQWVWNDQNSLLIPEQSITAAAITDTALNLRKGRETQKDERSCHAISKVGRR